MPKPFILPIVPTVDNQESEIDVDLEFGSIIDWYLKQYRLGKSESVESYASQYPEYHDQIVEILPMMMLMNNLGDKSTSSPSSLCRRIPDELGDYELLNKIGQGGMGNVYKALQVSLNRTVAIKVLSSQKETDCYEKLVREAQVLARLTHTNIVSVFGISIENDLPYMVMEYIEGASVDQIDWQDFYPGESNESAVAKLGLQAAQALAYSHEQGVVHLDIKPSNLLVDDKGTVHISDFGLAALFDREQSNPAAQLSGGTLRYMAPERFMDKPRPDNGQKADQYALGITLYELLTDQIAFDPSEIPCKTTGELIKRICVGPSPKVRCDSPELAAVINKAMAHNPADRYDSMDAMADDLRRYLACQPVKARNPSVLRRAWFWSKRQPHTAILTLIALLCLVGLFISLAVGYTNSEKNLQAESRLRQEAQKNFQIAEKNFQLANGVIDYVLFEGLYPQSRLLYELETAEQCPPVVQTNLKLIHKLGWYYYCLAQKKDINISALIDTPYSPDSLNELLNRIQKMNPDDRRVIIIAGLRMDYSMSDEDIDKTLKDLRQMRKECSQTTGYKSK